MTIEIVPECVSGLDDKDIIFIKRFLMASGPLKEVANFYGVIYYTVRLRLDRLIQKIKINEETPKYPCIGLIKKLALNENFDFDTAKILITEFKKIREDL